MIHIVKGFSTVYGTEIDVFLKFPCFLCNPENVGNLISSSSSFSKLGLDIWKFLVRIMLKPSMQDFKHDLASMGDERHCPTVSTFLWYYPSWELEWGFTFSSPVATAGSSRSADITNAKPCWHHPLRIWIKLITFFEAEDGEAVYSQQKKDLELTMAQIISFSKQNSGLN